MPTGLKRFQQTRQFHFITFSCYKRQPFLHTAAAKDTVQQILEQTRKQQGLRIAAYVLMPEHVHLLTNEPAKSTLDTLPPNLPPKRPPQEITTSGNPLTTPHSYIPQAGKSPKGFLFQSMTTHVRMTFLRCAQEITQ